MSRISRSTVSIAVAGLYIAWSGSAVAGAFNIQEQSVQGLGRAYSGEAAAVGADSLWWNPAAIAEVEGIEIYDGAHLVLSNGNVVDQGSTITRPGQATAPVGGEQSAHNPIEPGLVPNIDAAWRVSPLLAFGLAVSAPFDLTTKYDPDSFVRYQAQTSKLVDLDVQPTIAAHVASWLDVGAGFDAQYASSTLSSALPNLSPLLSDGFNRLQGSGWYYGWTLGAQIRPTERLTFGASYRSSIDHQLDGPVTISGLLGPLAGLNGTEPGVARFTTPWITVLGARYVLTPHWTLDAELQWVGWSDFNAITVQTATGSNVTPQGYHDTTRGAVGADYTVNRMWTFRAGVAYDPTPTPDVGRSARVPDGNRWLFALGATARLSPRIELYGALAYVDVGSAALVSQSVDYAGTPAATAISYDAETTGSAVIISSGVKLRF